MALAHEVETLDGIDEKYRGWYSEQDGKFVLDPQLREDTSGLKSALQRANDRAKGAEDRLKSFDGIDNPDEVRELLKKQDDIRQKKLIETGKVEEVVAERLKPVTDENNTLKDTIGRLEAEVRQFTLTDKLTDAALKGYAHESAIADIVRRAEAVWTIQDGKPIALTAEGVAIGGKDGQPIEMDEWLANLTTEAPHLFKSSNGGGAPPDGGGGGGPPKGKKRSEMTSTEKSDYISEHGGEAFRKLPQ